MLIKLNTTPGFSLFIAGGAGGFGYWVAKAGAAAVAGTGSFSSNPAGGGAGWQITITPAAGETDTLGDLFFFVNDAGSNWIGGIGHQVVAFDPTDATALGLGNLNAPVGTVLADVGTLLTDMTTALGDLSALLINVAGVPDAVLDQSNGIDLALTPREALRLIVAALAAKIAISGTTVTIRDTADTKNRIVATVDGTGQRTALTYNKT